MEPNQIQQEALQTEASKKENKTKIIVIILAIIIVIVAIMLSRKETEAPTNQTPETRDLGIQEVQQ